ncbi:TetR family transcriptional regulator [Labrys miyagiensis]|uniref:TetR family transcriptional regulator n=1 Tax=Labrys miyagiensis TaxID=346912 RepID=A0ABQ6CPN7_9HYPH|nr:TetR/AcrR family transcriptional regulator [Labrys miyagiensis]GLS22306.1 TetR family transcriptional regulator [Labrys miyagiensis]
MSTGTVRQSRAQARQDATRQRILDAARDIIQQQGFRGLSIRTIASAVNCSVGTIYNHFCDFDDIVLHLNAETIARLDAVLEEAVFGQPDWRPSALVDVYFDFLELNNAAWRALFEHHLPRDYRVPDWYREGVDTLVGHVVAAFAPLLPHLSREDCAELIVGLWAGLHGLASLDQEDKLSTVSVGSSARKVGQMLVRTALRGAGASRA